MAVPTHLAQIVFNPESYTDMALIDRTYEELRRVAPLDIAELPGFPPVRLVTRHADIREVARRNDDFHNGDQSVILVPTGYEEEVKKRRGGHPNMIRTLVQMDGSEHKQNRVVTQGPLMRPNVAKLEDSIRSIARKYVDRFLASNGECDFAEEIAFYYPLEVVLSLVGVPPEDHAHLLKLTQWLFGAADPELRQSAAPPATVAESVDQTETVCSAFREYFEHFSASRRTKPQDDLGSLVANATINGCPMGDWETISYYIIMSTAGHDSSAATIATSMWVLAENPALLNRVRDTPTLINGFVDEAIRWATPVKHFMRSASRDTEVGGVPISRGEKLMLCYPSGNRDEAVFKDPFTFDPERSPNPHLAFGHGGHICLGQHLARLEMQIFWQELLPHLASLELAGQVDLMSVNFVSGPKRVPVRFAMS